MGFFSNTKKKLVTHNGTFHTDDVFACATLQIYLDRKGEDYEIIRTRDPEWFSNGDYVFDVGGIYDPQKNRFDHHQREGAGERDNGIKYAACGLIWKHFGMDLCDDQEIFTHLDKKIFQPIDGVDNGQDVGSSVYEGIFPYTVQSMLNAYRPTWKEKKITDDGQFIKLVARAKDLMLRELIHAKDGLEAKREIKEAYENAEDKRLVILEKGFSREEINYTLSQEEEPLFFIYPKGDGLAWKLETVKKELETFESRKYLPKEWRGFKGKELEEITGVSGVEFVHNSGFLATAIKKDTILKLAKLALNS